jgi:putative ABC transport system substrate-binding protein
VALAATRHLAAIYELRFWVETGGLMSYGPMNSEFGRSWAECVDKILRGAHPSQVPVQQPTKFRAGDQPQDRQGARRDHPAVAAGAGG